MGFYSRYIFPRMMHFGMSGSSLAAYRSGTVAHASGHVLEIGFGTGLNLPWYSSRVLSITAVDPNPGMHRLARKQIEKSPFRIALHMADAKHLPFDDNSFDSIVSTWTLCSITPVEKALTELYRVLKQNGRYYFLEHGLSPESRVQKWQHRITPVNRIVGDGCHLNRNIRELVQAGPWVIEKLDEFYEESGPKFAGYLYQGVAIK